MAARLEPQHGSKRSWEAMIPAWVNAAADALASRAVAATTVHGGDVATAARVELADGRTVFGKTHPDPLPGFFSTEAAGLSWLAEPGVASVAQPLAVSDGDPAFLVIEWIDTDRGRGVDEAAFGRELAALHASGAPSFGREDRRTTGSLGLPNEPCATWVEFYASQRLAPLRAIAAQRHSLPVEMLERVDEVIAGLGELNGTLEPPARLHGDLWAGNRLVDRNGRSWLIDPAAHGGHREFDLAMMRLFGGFGPDAFAAYDAEFPLADGWQARVPVHQLAPLIVHAIKFGGHYVAATGDALSRIGVEPRPERNR